MNTKENLVLYKQRIKREMESLDPSLRDEYLDSEYKIYKQEYLADYPESYGQMRNFFECDRRRDDKMKKAVETPWSEVPLADKICAWVLGICLLGTIILFAF